MMNRLPHIKPAGAAGLLPGLSLLYITHDLLSAHVITDEILVLNQGKIVERGPARQVLQHPQHSSTIQLLDAVATPFAAADAGTPSRGRRET